MEIAHSRTALGPWTLPYCPAATPLSLLDPGPMHASDSPIHCLPAELLAEVFFLLGRSNGTSLRERTMQLTLISSVCSIWRETALCTATLWTSITYRYPRQQATSVAISRVTAYLERSKNASIDVSIVFAAEDPEASQIWGIFLPHLDRCRSLEILCSTKAVARQLLPLPGRLSRLKRLEWGAPSESDDFVTLFDEANEAPLQTLSIFGPVSTSSLSNIVTSALNFVSFTRASIWSWPEVACFLSRCPLVENVHIGFYDDSLSTPQTDKIVIPSLKMLSVVDRLPLSFHHYISIPCLQNLLIRGDGRLDTTAAPATEPCWPLLRSVTLMHMTPCVPENLISLFESNPGISSLSIVSCGQHVAVILLLLLGSINSESPSDLHTRQLSGSITKTARSDILPNLRKLRFQNCRSGYRSGQVGPAIRALLSRRLGLRVECDLRSIECSETMAHNVTNGYGDRFELLRG